MALQREIFFPYFNPIEKKIIYSALDEAADYLREFYCFSPREWFNYCYDVQTELEGEVNCSQKKAFAEVQKCIPPPEKASVFQKERYQICLFDHNILRTLWKQSNMEFYPFMVYILTHELVHVARFCQNLHPFECDQESLQKEEEKVNQLTQQVLNIKKTKTFNRVSSL
ncbi:MAG TPA: hypothetical protein PKV48_03275 [Thermodesulfobacteriota bacterium]|nr:hypothetical protein [Thermodesulfobacteriota bacterium]